MKESTFKIEAQSFFDAALAIQEGVKQGYKIETDDSAFFPQQFGHYYFMTMVEDNSTLVAEKDTAVEDNSTKALDKSEQPVVESAVVASEEQAKATVRKRKPKAETTELEVQPAAEPEVQPEQPAVESSAEPTVDTEETST